MLSHRAGFRGSLRRALGASAAVGFLTLASLGLPAPAHAAPRYDTIVRGGIIVDGSGLPRYKADVAIQGKHIVAIGDLSNAEAEATIDARGLIVAPGFINIHSHAEADAVATAINVLTQGVTTEIVNADGGGTADISEQLAEFAANGMALNLGAYVGFNAVWRETVGLEDRRATEGEIETMRSLIERNLERGAWGVSAGLDYKPGYYASADEVVKVVSVARSWRTNFPNHERVRPEENFDSFKGMSETISIAERAGLTPVITHIKSAGRNQGNSPDVIELMSEATARGVHTASDVYPYLSGMTGLGALMFPGWALEGGRPAMLERFKDEKLRAEIAAAAENAMKLRFNRPESVHVVNTDQELTEVMKDLNVGAGEAVIRLLEREPMWAIIRFGSEPDLVAYLKYSDTAIACDCGAMLGDEMHPRDYGTFPRVPGHYVRETGVLTLEEAIRKMTALPAATVGMVDRGYVAPGMIADIAIFDPETVKDNATYPEPTRLSDGIRHVLVNGQIAIRSGKPTGVRPGEALWRGSHMPSRPMTRERNRAVSAKARVANFEVSVAVSQRAGERASTGQLQLTDRESGALWTADQLGGIQAAPGWASLTAVVHDGRGDQRPLTLILDHLDAKVPERAMILSIDGARAVSGTLAGEVRLSIN